MITRDRAEHYTSGTGCDGWHLVKSPSFSVIQESMPPHTSEQRHKHASSRQFFFIMSGQATCEVDGKQEILLTHSGLEIPPGVPHQICNFSDANLEFLVVSCPPSHGDRILQQVTDGR